MSNDQLRWHLLREMSKTLLEKPKRNDGGPLFDLLMSGKGPAEAVRSFISQHVEVRSIISQHVEVINFPNLGVNLIIDNKSSNIKSVYFQKLAFRWARYLDFYRKNGHNVMAEYITMLPGYSNIEKLRFNTAKDYTAKSIALINASPNLSCLVAVYDFFCELLQNSHVNISKMRSVEISLFRSFNLKEVLDFAKTKFIFEALAKQPARCPLLESLTIKEKCGLANLLKCTSGSIIPTVKSLNIEVCFSTFTFADFPRVSSIAKAFPNVENVTLTGAAIVYIHEDVMQLIQAFKDFKCNYDCTIICNGGVHINAPTEKNAFETMIAAYGTVTSRVKPENLREYTITNSYPKKTLILQFDICFNDDMVPRHW